jgi:glycosyltransferase involved in cell wall biosynthesis
MRISIISPSLNQAPFIRQMIESIIHQDHTDIEHIVIDGGSSDGTVEILRQYSALRWVSEKDRGQTHAINKGFALASGQILAWLNADDYYAPNVLGAVHRYFHEHPDCNILYGDITYVDKAGEFLHVLSGDVINYPALVRSPDIVRQPSFFWRKHVVEKLGPLDESLHLVMDLDFLLRGTRLFPPHYIPLNVSYFRSYDEGKTKAQARRQVGEILRVYRKHHVPLTPSRWKYLLGKYLDSLHVRHPLRALLQPLRKPRPHV